MKVLVTGGAGFIGSNLVQALIARGDEVIVVDNLLSGYKKNLEVFPTVCFLQGDIRDANLVDKAMQGVEVVYHLAASVGNKRSIDNPILDAEINAMGTIKILEAARKHGIKKFVFSSSAGIFGELKQLPINEEHPTDPDTPYACSKLYAEKIALAYAKLYDLETVCLRYFNVYGPNQRFDAYGNVIPIFVFQMLRDEQVKIFGDGEQTRDFVNVADVVRANIQAGDAKGVVGAFNIGSGTSITINQLVHAIKEVSAQKFDVEYTAKRPGDVRDSLADISAAYKAFDFSPRISINDGLREYIAWARAEIRALSSS